MERPSNARAEPKQRPSFICFSTDIWLGVMKKIDEVIIKWPNGAKQELKILLMLIIRL